MHIENLSQRDFIDAARLPALDVLSPLGKAVPVAYFHFQILPSAVLCSF